MDNAYHLASSTAFFQKKLIVIRFNENQFHLILADLYLLAEFIKLFSIVMQKNKKKNYVWKSFLLIYLNSLITLLFVVEHTATLFSHGSIFILLHLIFLDIIKKCLPPEEHPLYHSFFSDLASKIPADNYSNTIALQT